MMSDGEKTLAAAVEAAVTGVAAVTTLFRTGSLVGNAAAAAAERLGIAESDAPLAVVRLDDDGARIEVSIGVSAAAAVADTIHEVQRAIEDVADAAGVTIASSRVTVVHIQG